MAYYLDHLIVREMVKIILSFAQTQFNILFDRNSQTAYRQKISTHLQIHQRMQCTHSLYLFVLCQAYLIFRFCQLIRLCCSLLSKIYEIGLRLAGQAYSDFPIGSVDILKSKDEGLISMSLLRVESFAQAYIFYFVSTIILQILSLNNHSITDHVCDLLIFFVVSLRLFCCL